MDQSWRFRPPPPVPYSPYSIPHFPLDRPPFPDPPNPNLPFHPISTPHNPLPIHHPPPFRDDLVERDGLYKRMRMDDGYKSYEAQSRLLAEERRLGLIRDHGGQQEDAERYLGYHQRRFDFQNVESFRGDWLNTGFESRFPEDRYGQFPGGFGMQRFQKLGDERSEFIGRSFDRDGDGRFEAAVDEFPYGEMRPAGWMVDSGMRYGHGERVMGNSEDHAGSGYLEEGGRMIRDNLYQSRGNAIGLEDPRLFGLHRASTLPRESKYFEPDRVLEHPERNYVGSRLEVMNQIDGPVKPSIDRNFPRYEDAHRPFGREDNLLLESFSPPNGNSLRLLPHFHVSASYDVVGSGSENIVLPLNHQSLMPLPIPSPPCEPRAPTIPNFMFPSGRSLETPKQVDQIGNFSAPPPPEVVPNVKSYPQAYPSNVAPSHFPIESATMSSTHVLPDLRNEHCQDIHPFPPKQLVIEKPIIVDAPRIFRKPHRADRPDHIVVILRGLPGSGKSYMAKLLRDIEVEEGGTVPRIHSMDDYFMTEVEKIEDSDGQKPSSSVRNKKQAVKKVMEYCYEPEMEEVYRASMLKAFKKTLDEGSFTFVIVDDRNLRVADFAQFWAMGKRSGYEVYLLEATYKDPMGCAARNVHGFTNEDIQKMAERWEEAPSLYMQIDTQSLFHADGLNGHDIQEVDMDMEEDAPCYEKDVSNSHLGLDAGDPKEHVIVGYDSPEASRKWDVEEDTVKELGRSKWSNDLDDDVEAKHVTKERMGALSGLVQAYSRVGKSVHWSDQGVKQGFSIGVPKSSSNLSLIIGPGSGYNLRSNPLPEEEASADASSKNVNGSKKHSLFLEHIRAEHESFRLVFDRRRQRIGISEGDDE